MQDSGHELGMQDETLFLAFLWAHACSSRYSLARAGFRRYQESPAPLAVALASYIRSCSVHFTCSTGMHACKWKERGATAHCFSYTGGSGIWRRCEVLVLASMSASPGRCLTWAMRCREGAIVLCPAERVKPEKGESGNVCCGGWR
jgi:hypothetical protein